MDYQGLLKSQHAIAGVDGPALNWLQSFLSNRTWRVVMGNWSLKALSSGPCRDPYHPLFFSMLTRDTRGLAANSMPMTIPTDATTATTNPSEYLQEISSWMKSRWLKLNLGKINGMPVGKRKHFEVLAKSLRSPLLSRAHRPHLSKCC